MRCAAALLHARSSAGMAPSGGGAPTAQPCSRLLPTECSAINEIRPREPIRCRECGHRIMYKKRTKRMVSLHTSQAELVGAAAQK